SFVRGEFCANPQTNGVITGQGADRIAIRRPQARRPLIKASAAQHELPSIERGDCDVPDVAGEIVDEEWTPRSGVTSDFVRPERAIFAAIGQIEIGVVRRELVSVGKLPRVSPARGSLPLAFGTESGTGNAAGAIQPGGVRQGVFG